MKGILELIKLIYGSKALSKILGTRTNVIRLPDNELKQYTKNELNIEAASDKLAQKAKADMYELLGDYPRMNDAEKLIFDGNLKRLGNKLGVTEKGPAADVLEFGTGEKVSPEGIMSLTEKAGQKSSPTTLMGKLESRVKQLEASGEDLSKMKGQTYDEFMDDITKGQRTMIKLEDEGLVRATAREIIDKDIKSKKIKLPKEVEADFKQGGGEPIDVFRQFYGEDALEQLNSMVPDFRQMYSSKEAAEAATKKFNFEFKADRPPGSISIEDAKKAEQEFNITPKKPTEPEDPEGFNVGGRVGYSIGSFIKGALLTAKTLSELKPEYLKKLSRLEGYLGSINMEAKGGKEAVKKTIDKIDTLKQEYKLLEKDLSEKKQLDEFNITDRTKNAEGGVSQGLDYLMGIERRGYAVGGTGPRMIDGVSQEGILPGFIKRRSEFYNADGTINQEKIKAANFFFNEDGTVNQVIPPTEFYYERIGKGGIGEGGGYDPKTYERIVAEFNEPSTLKSYSNVPELTQLMNDVNEKAGTTVIRNLEEADAYLKANAQTTPTEDFSDYLNTTTINTNVQTTPTGLASVAETLFPQGDFLNIRETAASPTEYNIEATKDLVENLPSVLQPFAPAAAAALSLPYDAIQAYQRMEPDSGIAGFRKAFQAERPLKSAFERFVGASGPLAENINTAVSSLNPFQQQRYMNYAVENPDRAIQAAQRDQDFRTSIQNRDQKQKGGLSYLLGM